MLIMLPFVVACSSNCEAGCYQAGAAKCDHCDAGYGLTVDGSCDRMFKA